MMHESSFVPPYDAFFKNKLASAYEKLTGIKINYEVVGVGSLQTRVTTAAENSTGTDMTAIGFNCAFLFDQKFVDVSDIAAEIGKESGGWYESAAESAVVNGKVEGDPVRQCRPADELAHRQVQAGRLRQVPGYLGRAARLDPSGDHLFVLRRALRRGTDRRVGQGVTSTANAMCDLAAFHHNLS